MKLKERVMAKDQTMILTCFGNRGFSLMNVMISLILSLFMRAIVAKESMFLISLRKDNDSSGDSVDVRRRTYNDIGFWVAKCVCERISRENKKSALKEDVSKREVGK
jgi:type II secretory pathway component PulJ